MPIRSATDASKYSATTLGQKVFTLQTLPPEPDTLKTPYRDGTTHVIFEPEDFIARLAALVPKPRAHLTRYHSVFAPPSPDRAQIVPSAVVHVGRSHARVRRPAD
jgi:hypothetical protein